MSDLENLSLELDDFSGVVRLFPLPNLVMFPTVMQPLHIFEQRYREMLAEALDSDRLIAMALLAPGWEQEYEGRPPLSPVACLGRVATAQRLADGTSNLLLLGLRRVGIIRELPPKKLFREAQVELLDDIYPACGAASRPGLQRRLVQSFEKLLPHLAEAQEQLDQLLGNNVPLGMLTDILSYTLDLGLPLKERLLCQRDVDQRAATLLEYLKRASQDTSQHSPHVGFPPQFSAN